MKPAEESPATTVTALLAARRSRPWLILAAAALTLLALMPRASAQAQLEPQRPAPALELARRLLGPWGDTGGMTVELAPQQLPEGMPTDLPLPSELTLLGSLANYGQGGELMHAQIVLDSPLEPDETLRLLERTFSSNGWRVQNQGGPTGFTPLHAHVAALYCSPENDAFIHMNSFGVPEGLTDVRLEVNTQTIYSPCGEGQPLAEEPPQTPLPALAAPLGSEITLHGGNFLEDQASSSAVLTTDLPPDELLRHFENQLERAGWMRESGTAPGESTWTLAREDGSWRGVLALTALGSTPPRYYASFVMVTTE